MLHYLFALLTGMNAHSAPLTPLDTEFAHYESVQFQTFDGYVLNGHLAIPQNAKPPYPAILMLVGSGTGDRYENIPGSVTSDRKDALLFRPIEEALVKQGIAVMTYDKRGVTPIDLSFQKVNVDSSIWRTANANNLAADALAAFDTLSTNPKINAAKIGILGHSEGTILALKIAEQREDNVRSLFMLGLLTRSMTDIFAYQAITNQIRLFAVLDLNGDGYLDQNEVEAARTADPVLAQQLTWPALLTMDKTKDGRVSEQEMRYATEQRLRQFLKLLANPTTELQQGMPADWYRQYFAEGAYLERHLKFCSKIRLFQGEIDIQTPFEDALELDENCKARGTPLASFISYPENGHGFSPRVGYRNSLDTVGPINPKLLMDIAEQAYRDLSAKASIQLTTN